MGSNIQYFYAFYTFIHNDFSNTFNDGLALIEIIYMLCTVCGNLSYFEHYLTHVGDTKMYMDYVISQTHASIV